MRRTILLFGLLVLLPQLPYARTWYVLPDSTGDVPTIRAGVDSAGYGDTVLVAAGTYYSDSTGTQAQAWIVLHDGVALVSEDGPDVTTLVKCPTLAGGTNRVVSLDGSWDTTLKGFTIRIYQYGECEPGGGVQFIAVSCDQAHAVIEDNIITGVFLKGIRARGPHPMSCSPVIRNNTVKGCLEYGIECANGGTNWSPWIEGNTIIQNATGLGIENIHPRVDGNVLSHNTRGTVVECPAVVTFQMNVITNNTDYGAWVHQGSAYPYTAPCFNCGMQKSTANDIYGNGSYDIYYEDDTGLGLIEARFNYWGSLCPVPSLHGNITLVPWVDSSHTLQCDACGSCHDATQPATWGSIKAIFR
jgi:hypothetical protein